MTENKENSAQETTATPAPPFELKSSTERMRPLFRIFGMLRRAARESRSGLRQLKEAHSDRRDNIFRPLFTHLLWGRRPRLLLSLTLFVLLIVGVTNILFSNYALERFAGAMMPRNTSYFGYGDLLP